MTTCDLFNKEEEHMFHWFNTESLIFQILALRFYDNISDLFSEENMINNFGEIIRIVLPNSESSFSKWWRTCWFPLKGFDVAIHFDDYGERH